MGQVILWTIHRRRRLVQGTKFSGSLRQSETVDMCVATVSFKFSSESSHTWITSLVEGEYIFYSYHLTSTEGECWIAVL